MTLEQALEQLGSAPTFSRVVDYLERQMLAEPLRAYRATLAQSVDPAEPGTKAIKDAIWGMIHLTRSEVTVVDSPPLQRLRRIRQLGLGYLTYPTAGYSRFEHTLGALQQADTMLRAVASRTGRVIDTSSGQPTRAGEPELLKMLGVVRLAALLHDVGHLPLSHVSERFYSREECGDDTLVKEVSDLRDEVQHALEVKKPSLSECLSLAVVQAPSMSDFLTSEGMYTRTEVQAAAAAVVGRAPSTRQAFVYQLITNVIDADKLDYMFRDGFLTGVPLAVDLQRLLYKLKCVELPAGQLPNSLAAIQTNDDPALVLGIDVAGERLAYDVTVARTMLFERVYLHHKTRAAERVAMRRLGEFNAKPWWLLAFDDSLFTGDQPMSEAVRMLRARDLPKRAYGLSHRFLPGPGVGELDDSPELPKEQADSWTRLRYDLRRARARARLEEKILICANRIAAELEENATVTDVWVDTVPGRGDLGTWDLWVETPDGEVTVAQTYDARAAAFAHSPGQTFFVYVSGTGRVVEVGFLAAEYVMATRYGLFVGRRAADSAKVSFRVVEDLKRKLERLLPGFYDAAGRLRPEPMYLRQVSNIDRVGKLASRFGHYHGEANTYLDSKRITDFLRQFPEPLGEQMLTLLESVLFLDRSDLGEELAAYLADGASPSESFVPLTDKPDKSASHLPYFLADRRETRLNVVSLANALAADGPITLFDDCNISGSQSRTAVQVWLGLDPDLPDEADTLARGLTKKQIAQLKERSLRFRFAYSHELGMTRLKELLSGCGLDADVAARYVEAREKPLAEVVSQELLEFLRLVGRDLLGSTKAEADPTRWTDQRCDEFALGYGDSQQLVVMFYNAPTGAVTALWKGGRFRGSPWLPLFPRRGEPGVVRPLGQAPLE
jgi:HD superfamily phosphohydrolase